MKSACRIAVIQMSAEETKEKSISRALSQIEKAAAVRRGFCRASGNVLLPL